MCSCNLCRAREENKHSWEVYFEGKREADFVRLYPGHPIYYYEAARRAEEIGWKIDKEETLRMAGICNSAIYGEWENKRREEQCRSNLEKKHKG